MFKIAVFVSGGGSNLQAILDAIDNGYLKGVEVSCILADRDCYALERAKKHGVEYHILKKAEFLSFLEKKDLDLIVLAGYLSIIPKQLIQKWENRVINIHPSLLPKFGGKGMHGIHVHEAVITAGESISGCTVHYVTEDIDSGEILAQETVVVEEEDTAEALQARVLEMEHLLLPRVIRELKEERKE